MSEGIKVKFSVPMKRIKKDLVVADENMTIREIFSQEGQSTTDLADVVIDTKSISDYPKKLDTPLRDLESVQNGEEVYLWGMIQSEGGME